MDAVQNHSMQQTLPNGTIDCSPTPRIQLQLGALLTRTEHQGHSHILLCNPLLRFPKPTDIAQRHHHLQHPTQNQLALDTKILKAKLPSKLQHTFRLFQAFCQRPHFRSKSQQQGEKCICLRRPTRTKHRSMRATSVYARHCI